MKRATALVTVLVLTLAACGGGDGDDAVSAAPVVAESQQDQVVSTDESVAAAAGDTDTADSVGASTAAEASDEERALDFAQCMRDNGFPQFPDPEIGGNGNLNFRGGLQDAGIDFQSEEFQSQLALCQEEAGADNFGAGARNNDARAGVQENLLSYTQCLRDEGLDVGDLGGGGPGAGGPGGGNGPGGGGNGAGNGDGGGPGAGQARGNGGAGVDRSARFAQVLGLDVADPAVAAALETCEPVLEEAFAGAFGGNAPGAAPAADNNS